MLFEVSTGRNEIQVMGNNAVLKRKNGESIPIPSTSALAKLYKELAAKNTPEVQKKLKDYSDKFPKIMEGDTIITGDNTIVIVRSSYNKGKDKPIEGMKQTASKSINFGPDSEIRFLGVKKWIREDKTAQKKYFGEMIETIEVKKAGFFYCSYSNCEDTLITPTALVDFLGLGGGVTFDYYNGALYSVPCPSEGIGEKGSIKFTNKNTKKFFTSKTIEEVIVTSNAIYKKSFAKMDQINFFSASQIGMLAVKDFIPDTSEDQYAQMAKTGDKMMEVFANIEMFKQMDPKDIIKLAKQGGATPEQLKEFEDLPEKLKMMEKQMPMDKVINVVAQQKAFYEGMGAQGFASMAKVQKKAQVKMNEHFDKEFKEFANKSKEPRKYGPLTNEFKVA